MYDWKDTVAARQHRDDLLCEAERPRAAGALGRKRGRRSSLASDIRWELARGPGFAGKTLRHLPTRG